MLLSSLLAAVQELQTKKFIHVIFVSCNLPKEEKERNILYWLMMENLINALIVDMLSEK